MSSWARTAASAGYAVQDGLSFASADESVDLVLIEGAVVRRPVLARRTFVVDDGSSEPILAERLGVASGTAILCPDPDRVTRLSAQGLPALPLSPVLDAWRWTRPVRLASPKSRIVVATDVAAGRLSGLASLPLPEAGEGTDAEYTSSVQAVILDRPEQHLFHAFVALATGLPLVLPLQSLRWLGPLATLRCPVEEASGELHRLASDPAAWFDQVQEGLDSLKKLAPAKRFLADLATLMRL